MCAGVYLRVITCASDFAMYHSSPFNILTGKTGDESANNVVTQELVKVLKIREGV